MNGAEGALFAGGAGSDNAGVMSEEPPSPSGTDFQPSEAQQRVLDHFQAEKYECTVVDACAKCEVPRRTFYNWFDKPEFVRWWDQQAERWAAMQKGRVYGALARSAGGEDVGGTPADRKTYLERFDKGYAPKRREELSSDGPLGITVHVTKTYEQPEAPASAGEGDGQPEGEAGDPND